MAQFQFQPGALVALANDEEGSLYFWCPGCSQLHVVTTKQPNVSGSIWRWNGCYFQPSIEPSVLLKGPGGCHLWVENGHLRFCGDSSHHLSGKTLPMEVPDWLR